MIAVRGLTARRGDVVVLDDVDLTIDDGESVLLVGPNGSGKTTLVRQFNALLTPEAGTVEVDGHDAHEAPVTARTSVGMVFQHPRDQFVAATVGADVAFGPENLGLERSEIDDRVDRALAAVGLTGERQSRIADLSGGEQARVAIAGALAMEPAHLVLDEPLTGLDLAARRSVLDHLATLSNGETSVVVVTHDLRDLTEIADRIVALVDGEIALDGPPSAVLDELDGVGVRDPRC
ncbi:ATP-binding cassette domain-containing protein [Halomicrobium mukohataei]|uniref:ATP-binding cassette domain-containing protein n=1 Tax=Halomicrobium mukohataei TaxID=57705 RepID=A0A847UBV7_9EURY|nr:ABC transporter ATP-binding protein [Halomicrobium mukohataei]NLV08754.1 ATP-binding cassette domain-containing protein [Halomicrobium mukohataei]